ncbi:unnamed protein product [Dibothriocephalus latus]|uniref:Uncharacterized protein n=1 Tax=Dibothriocephalus latus TaxID=60516 RepID=A0A3P7PUU0_DIBLA|nr:unnamed protein product [Dibothriocephalus latus]
MEIRSRLTTQADNEGSSKYSSLKASVNGAAEKILGFTQLCCCDWISRRTLQVSAETTRVMSHHEASFRQLRKLTEKLARDDRQKYWFEMATSMEQASNLVDTRKL